MIGAREIYDAVIRVSGKVDGLVQQMADQHARATDHETRLRALERARWPLPSLAVLIAVGSLIATVLAR
jgi:hypothetical protein